MKKNIKMNKEQMEVSKYRAIIPYGEDNIVIKNINKELRDKIVELVANSIENNEEIDNVSIINMLVEELTNVEFEIPITDIKEPSHHVSMILHYINEMITELSEEIILASRVVVESKKVEISSEETKDFFIKQAEEIQEKLERKKEEEKELPKKNIKKPSRRKGSVSRR